MSRDSCNGCFYHRPLSYLDENLKCCHYCIIEGKLRGCPADECDKKLVVDKETEKAMLKEYNSKQLYNIARSRSKGGAQE